MGINLSKGQKVSLTKDNPGLKKLRVGLGWDTNKYDGGTDFDLDASAFLTDANGKVTSQSDFVFYGNLKHTSGSVESLGDNRTGDGEGDDETVLVDLSLIPANIEKVSFTCTIYEADTRCQNFGQVSNAFIHVMNDENGEELVRFDLGEDFSIETAVVIAEIYKHNSEWKFNAVGAGFQGGLKALCDNFGIDAN